MKRLIVNGDDFGLAVPVNEAIEKAHREGILTTTSLMVGEAAAADAVARARENSDLRVGLHLVLVEGRPLLAASAIPDLVDANGEFHRDLVGAGFRFFFRRGVRRQLEAEIRAQFEAFADSGLRLDHVNAHNHMHLHPTVLGLVLAVGRDHGLAAMRIPFEPPVASWRAARHAAAPGSAPATPGLGSRLLGSLSLAPWAGLLRTRLRRAGVKCNDYVFGLHDTGAVDEARVLGFIEALPDGVTEIYCHLATRRCPEIDRNMASYRHADELAALTSPRVRAALERAGIKPIAFADL